MANHTAHPEELAARLARSEQKRQRLRTNLRKFREKLIDTNKLLGLFNEIKDEKDAAERRLVPLAAAARELETVQRQHAADRRKLAEAQSQLADKSRELNDLDTINSRLRLKIEASVSDGTQRLSRELERCKQDRHAAVQAAQQAERRTGQANAQLQAAQATVAELQAQVHALQSGPSPTAAHPPPRSPRLGHAAASASSRQVNDLRASLEGRLDCLAAEVRGRSSGTAVRPSSGAESAADELLREMRALRRKLTDRGDAGGAKKRRRLRVAADDEEHEQEEVQEDADEHEERREEEDAASFALELEEALSPAAAVAGQAVSGETAAAGPPNRLASKRKVALAEAPEVCMPRDEFQSRMKGHFSRRHVATPAVCGRQVDLFSLYVLVASHGGPEAATKQRRWTVLWRELTGQSDSLTDAASASNAGWQLKTLYGKFISPVLDKEGQQGGFGAEGGQQRLKRASLSSPQEDAVRVGCAEASDVVRLLSSAATGPASGRLESLLVQWATVLSWEERESLGTLTKGKGEMQRRGVSGRVGEPGLVAPLAGPSLVRKLRPLCEAALLAAGPFEAAAPIFCNAVAAVGATAGVTPTEIERSSSGTCCAFLALICHVLDGATAGRRGSDPSTAGCGLATAVLRCMQRQLLAFDGEECIARHLGYAYGVLCGLRGAVSAGRVCLYELLHHRRYLQLDTIDVAPTIDAIRRGFPQLGPTHGLAMPADENAEKLSGLWHMMALARPTLQPATDRGGRERRHVVINHYQ